MDLEKAYDCVPKSVLRGLLREYGLDGFLLQAIQSLYCRSRSLVRIAGNKSDPFPVRIGLHSGYLLSSVLFLIFMDRNSRHSQVMERVRIPSLLFGDYMVLLASSNSDLQFPLRWFAAKCEAAGMKINTSVASPSKGVQVSWDLVQE